ncbi:hypothetical protein Dsin_012393 [Dipteronia sinensis]|uniref:BING4 C-terminal domain-containing protein n=1 Tax=Dipteronia sinensis TaxID=43782 RepID=A0AAE0E7X2_9ROSI|nr:hypothetical protein Dsin_012393 [Dipteronia sinensis]
MAAAGRKGHLAVVDMKNMNLVKEIQVRETVCDVVFLRNEHFFAAAWKKNRFLLASINQFGQLHYQDVTMGEMVGNFRTGFGRTDVMQVNSYNGVVAMGHSGGTVTMWKPTTSAALVKMLCHPGPVSAWAFHPTGHLMATSGKEKKIKIWDLRKFEVLQSIPGHAKCEPNFDSWVAIPFEKTEQRREKEVVRSLLDKLPPETIMLNPSKIGTVRPATVRPAWKKEKPTKHEREANMKATIGDVKYIAMKKKTKGRNKSSKVEKKK